MGQADRKGRPIEQIIHSIEPLIEDSVPRTGIPPAIPEPAPVPPATPVPAPETPAETAPVAATNPAPVAVPLAAPSVPTIPPLPPVPELPRKKHTRFIAAIIIVIVIIAVVGGGFMLMKNKGSNTVAPPVTTPLPTTQTPLPTPTPTLVLTAVVTKVPTTPQTVVPQSGVWVEITYDKTYSGSVGVPGAQQEVTDTGDHFYRIPTEYAIAVSVQKTDGSGDALKVNVYNDGTTVKTDSTTIPYGSVDMQVSLATPTPTPTQVLTPLPTLPLTSNTTAKVNTTAK